MPYKISGTKSKTARIIVFKESDWSIESNTVISGSGAYEITDLVAGNKLVVCKDEYGELLAYGAIAAVEMPAAVFEVGPGKEYASINDALVDASDGDQINVYPAEYYTEAIITKYVNLKAITDTPSLGEVKFEVNTTHAVNLSGLTNPSTETTMVIEGFSFNLFSTSTWRTAVVLPGNDTPNLNITLNKLNIDAIPNTKTCLYGGDHYYGNIIVSNSKLYRGYATTSTMYWNKMANGGRLDKVEFNGTPVHADAVGTITYDDSVTTPTAGYGCDAGDFILS